MGAAILAVPTEPLPNAYGSFRSPHAPAGYRRDMAKYYPAAVLALCLLAVLTFVAATSQ
jgi:hypothetical protein